MQVWRGTEEVPADLGPTVATLGIFDGVHRGHQVVLGATVSEAEDAGWTSVAITFDPHPATVHRPDEHFELIASLTDRLERLAATGVDAVLVLEYTLDLARHTPEQFARRFLVDTLHAGLVVVGEDVRFGWQNAGDQHTMVRLGHQLGFGVRIVKDIECPDTGRRWSSTWVRELLAAGDVAGAANVLGRTAPRARRRRPRGPARPPARLPHRQPPRRRPRRRARRRRLRRLAHPPRPRARRRHLQAPARGDLGGHQPDLPGRRAHRGGLRAGPHRPRPVRRGGRRRARRAAAAHGRLRRHPRPARADGRRRRPHRRPPRRARPAAARRGRRGHVPAAAGGPAGAQAAGRGRRPGRSRARPPLRGVPAGCHGRRTESHPTPRRPAAGASVPSSMRGDHERGLAAFARPVRRDLQPLLRARHPRAAPGPARRPRPAPHRRRQGARRRRPRRRERVGQRPGHPRAPALRRHAERPHPRDHQRAQRSTPTRSRPRCGRWPPGAAGPPPAR